MQSPEMKISKKKQHDFGFQLVRAVKKHPCLYNYHLKEYSQREPVEEAWRKIGQELKGDPKQLRDKWRNYRTVFLRGIKKDSTNNTYFLSEEMKFLLDYVKVTVPLSNRTSITSGAADLSEVQSDMETAEIEVENEDLEAYSGKIVYDYGSYTNNASPPKKEAPVATTVVTPAASENTRKLFFMLIAPEVDKMTDKQFRGLRKLVLDYLDTCEDEATPN